MQQRQMEAPIARGRAGAAAQEPPQQVAAVAQYPMWASDPRADRSEITGARWRRVLNDCGVPNTNCPGIEWVVGAEMAGLGGEVRRTSPLGTPPNSPDQPAIFAVVGAADELVLGLAVHCFVVWQTQPH